VIAVVQVRPEVPLAGDGRHRRLPRSAGMTAVVQVRPEVPLAGPAGTGGSPGVQA
jgi:hypothetical protein